MDQKVISDFVVAVPAVFRRCLASLAFAAAALGATYAGADPPVPATSDAQLRMTLDRRTVLRAALERNPAARVPEQRARAMRAAARAEGDLPSPELMGQVWQVPFSNPTALDSQMIMVGLTQSFPAPGALSAREKSMTAQANQEQAMAGDRARMICGMLDMRSRITKRRRRGIEFIARTIGSRGISPMSLLRATAPAARSAM